MVRRSGRSASHSLTHSYAAISLLLRFTPMDPYRNNIRLCLHLHLAFLFCCFFFSSLSFAKVSVTLSTNVLLFRCHFLLFVGWFYFVYCHCLCKRSKQDTKKTKKQKKIIPTKLSKMFAERLLTQTPLRHDKALSCSFNLYHFPAKLSHGIFCDSMSCMRGFWSAFFCVCVSLAALIL